MPAEPGDRPGRSSALGDHENLQRGRHDGSTGAVPMSRRDPPPRSGAAAVPTTSVMGDLGAGAMVLRFGGQPVR